MEESVLELSPEAAIVLDGNALEELRQSFLRLYPDFMSFSQASGRYWEQERRYKQELIDAIGDVVRSSEQMDELDLGQTLLDTLSTKGDELLDWRINRLVRNVRQTFPQALERACARLVRDTRPPHKAIGHFVEETWPLILQAQHLQGQTSASPYNVSRTLPSMVLALAYPDRMLPIRSDPTSEAAWVLWHQRIFANAPLSAEEVQRVLHLGWQLFTVMQDEWGWKPRDLWDVHGFLWGIHVEKKLKKKAASAAAPAPDKVSAPATDTCSGQSAQNIILYGPPGTGKTYETRALAVRLCDGEAPGEEGDLQRRYEALREEGRIEFVTFHQSYSYEEFVEGLRPVPNGDGTGFHLEPRPGVFRRISERALDAYNVARSEGRRAPDYVLVIDEINRANISRVLGELITLLEPDKRLGQKNALHVTLPYSGELFGAPPNLHVVGTMNTADRSIALLDTALRRRFEFRELMPRPERLSSDLEGIDLAGVLQAINDRIEYLFDRDHQIGHAYFMDCRTRTDVDDVMRHKVIPLLVEYFHEDWEKVRAVLNEENDDGAFICRTVLKPPRLLADEDAGDEPRWRYQVRESFVEDAYQRLIG